MRVTKNVNREVEIFSAPIPGGFVMDMASESKQAQESDRGSSLDAKVLSSRQLFDGDREILIEHGGEHYRLRITRRNRLILQK
jgi:hemin uptake protein HemP